MTTGNKIGRHGSRNWHRRIKHARHARTHAHQDSRRRVTTPIQKKSRMIMPQLKAVQSILPQLPQISFFKSSSKPIAPLAGKARMRS